MEDFQKIMDGMPTEVSIGHAESSEANDTCVVVLNFSEKGYGFGEVTILQTPKGVFLDTEYMGKERCLKYFAALFDGAITESDMDPERHALYNREMGRTCADGCVACAAVPGVTTTKEPT